MNQLFNKKDEKCLTDESTFNKKDEKCLTGESTFNQHFNQRLRKAAKSGDKRSVLFLKEQEDKISGNCAACFKQW